MKRIASLLALFFAASYVFAQSLEFSPGERHVDGQGRVTHATTTSWFNSIRPSVRANMVSRTSNGEEERFLVLIVPTLTLRSVAAGSELQIELDGGETVSLKSSEGSSLAQESGNLSIITIHIPYRITEDQVAQISSKTVKQMRIEGDGKTVEFSPKGRVSAIIKHQNEELRSLVEGNAGSPGGKPATSSQERITAQNNSGKVAEQSGARFVIHETPETKTFYVNSIRSLGLGPVMGNHFIVVEENTHNAFIFDRQGNLKGRQRLATRDISMKGASRPGIEKYYFTDDRAIVMLEDDDLAIIDPTGKVLRNFGKDMGEFDQFLDGWAVIPLESDRYKCTYRNLAGEIVNSELLCAPEYPAKVYLFPVKDGLRRYRQAYTQVYGFLSPEGKMAIPVKYKDASDFSEGLAAVSIMDGSQELWGFIDTKGNWVIEPVFSNRPDDFHDGYAVVMKKNQKYVFIDRQGNVCSDEYIRATRFIDGNALVSEVAEESMIPRVRQFSVIDKEFKVISKADIDKAAFLSFEDQTNTVFGHGVSIASNGVFSSDGKLLIENTGPFYTDLTFFQMTVDGKQQKGYVNLNGEVVLKFVESEF